MLLFLSNYKIRRGESLVEVVIALGIIIFVFSGVLTVVALSINLNLSARQRNEAINTAANKLNKFYIEGDEVTQLDSGTCVIIPVAPRNTNVPIGDSFAAACKSDVQAGELTWPTTLPTSKACDYVILQPLHADADASKNEVDTAAGTMLTGDNYIKVESHVKYFVRGIGVQEYVVTKLIRKR